MEYSTKMDHENVNGDVQVSIITVSYNSEKTIRRTMESVLCQSYKNIEYIIIDGASTDSTVNIIKEFEDQFGGRLVWVSEPDDGIYHAMNKGIAMATGDLIGILNSDDYYEPDAVDDMVNALGNEKYQILYGFVRTLKNGEEYSIEIHTHKDLRNEMIAHPSCFVTRQVYADFGTYNTKYKSVADYDFMLRMFDNKKVMFKPVYKLIANFEQGGMSSTAMAWLELLKLQREYGIITPGEYKKTMIKYRLHTLIHTVINEIMAVQSAKGDLE